MPKRTQAPAVPDFRLEKVECLVTGRKAQPLPIPQINEGGKTCVPINSTDNWLPKVISGHCRGDGSIIVKEFIDEVELLLATASLDDEGGETRGRPLAAAEGAGGSSPKSKKARKNLSLGAGESPPMCGLLWAAGLRRPRPDQAVSEARCLRLRAGTMHMPARSSSWARRPFFMRWQ